MASSFIRCWFVFIVLGSLLVVTVARTCSYTYYTYDYELGYSVSKYGYQYCMYGCCGTSQYYTCCSDSYHYYYYDNELTAGAITGIVLGCLVSFAIIIGIIVCSVVMCRNSRLKRRQTVSSAGVIYQPSQGVTFVQAGHGQMNSNGIVFQPAPAIQQVPQPNLQASHVVQYPTLSHNFQQWQNAHVPTAAGNQTSPTASLPSQPSGTTAEKSNPPPPKYTA